MFIVIIKILYYTLSKFNSLTKNVILRILFMSNLKLIHLFKKKNLHLNIKCNIFLVRICMEINQSITFTQLINYYTTY